MCTFFTAFLLKKDAEYCREVFKSNDGIREGGGVAGREGSRRRVAVRFATYHTSPTWLWRETITI